MRHLVSPSCDGRERTKGLLDSLIKIFLQFLGEVLQETNREKKAVSPHHLKENTRELKVLEPRKPLKNKLPGGVSQHTAGISWMLLQCCYTAEMHHECCQRRSVENEPGCSALDQVVVGCTRWVARAVNKEGGLLTCLPQGFLATAGDMMTEPESCRTV